MWLHFSTTLFFFFLVSVGVSWRHLLLSVQSKWSQYHCWWLHQWTSINSLFKNKIGYLCIFLQCKNKGEGMYSASVITHSVTIQMSGSPRNSLVLYWSYAWLFRSWAITVRCFFVVLINSSSYKDKCSLSADCIRLKRQYFKDFINSRAESEFLIFPQTFKNCIWRNVYWYKGWNNL